MFSSAVSALSMKVCYACSWGLKCCRWVYFPHPKRIHGDLLHTAGAFSMSLLVVFHADFHHQHAAWKSPWVHVGQVCSLGVHFFKNISTFFPPWMLFHHCLLLRSTVDGGLSIPRIIINHLKWLDRVVDSKVAISVTTGGSDDWTVSIFSFVYCAHP